MTLDARELADLVTVPAERHGVPADVMVALILQESGGDPWAWNPEPRYRWFWDLRLNKPFRTVDPSEIASQFPPSDFYSMRGTDPDQEWWAQQASFGLCQVMGAVAREAGFGGPFLTALCDPETNVEYGCRKFGADLRWAKGDVRSALASFNGGRKGNAPGAQLRNAAYADKVLGRLA